MTNEDFSRPNAPFAGPQSVTMRGPADMAELLPYLLGFYPDDSIVAVGLLEPDLRQDGVIRVDIPESPGHWAAAARETAALLKEYGSLRDSRPGQVLLYLCQDPAGGSAAPVDRLRPLADELKAAFESRGVLVKESLCVARGRWWSFLCRGADCCDPSGHPIRGNGRGPGPVAAAAAYAGLAPRGSRKAIVAGLAPVGPPEAGPQRLAFARALAAAARSADAARAAGAPGSLRAGADLLEQVVAEFEAGAQHLDEERTALLVLALQDRALRDRAAEFAEPRELAPAQRLWRYLARHCVPPYTGFASPPLTLLAWTAWIAGDHGTARVVLGHVLRQDPAYSLAQLLFESINTGLSPEALLEGVRAERAGRAEALRLRAQLAAHRPDEPPFSGPDPVGGGEPAPDRPRGGRPAAPGAVRRAVPGEGAEVRPGAVRTDVSADVSAVGAAPDDRVARPGPGGEPDAGEPLAGGDPIGEDGGESATRTSDPAVGSGPPAHRRARERRLPSGRPVRRPVRACGPHPAGAAPADPLAAKVRLGRLVQRSGPTSTGGVCHGAVRGRTHRVRHGS